MKLLLSKRTVYISISNSKGDNNSIIVEKIMKSYFCYFARGDLGVMQVWVPSLGKGAPRKYADDGV